MTKLYSVMGFWQIIVLSLFVSAKAQNTIENCPSGLISDEDYDVIHRVESGGDLCKIDGNKIGPFQISKEYYDEATEFDPSLLNEGKYRLANNIVRTFKK